MAAAVVAPNNNNNNGTSPHSSAASSPQSHTSRLPQHTGAPLYTQEEVVRFVQAALAAAYRDQANARQPNTQSLQEERIMKPRVHMFETFGPKRMMVTTLELPGLQKEDVHITARTSGELVISGERKPQHLLYLQSIRGENDHEENAEESGRTVFNELKFGKFQRSIRLPAGTDPSSINASMDDGMLTITWPLPTYSRTTISHDAETDDNRMNDALDNFTLPFRSRFLHALRWCRDALFVNPGN